MKTKLIFTAIIAAIFIAAMLIFNKTMTLGEIILAFVGASGTIGWVWNWINAKDEKAEKKELKEENEALRELNRGLRK